MTGQKVADRFGFMRAQVVANDVNGLLWSLACDQIFQKRNELRTGVAVAGLSDHFPALGIQSRIERERSMAVVFKAVSFGATGRKWQNWIHAALSGGLRYKPMTSAAFSSNSGSVLAM
jgi:hypothetical protein